MAIAMIRQSVFFIFIFLSSITYCQPNSLKKAETCLLSAAAVSSAEASPANYGAAAVSMSSASPAGNVLAQVPAASIAR